jgi:hypothetical protein
MKRWHEDFTVSKRQWKKHRKDHVESNKQWVREVGKDPYIVDCDCDEQIGRFRKKDAYDCGNTQCYICHNDKFPKRELTRKEEKSKLSFKEQLKDLN